MFSESGASLVQPDEPFVRRPWKNSAETVSGLISAILAERIECLLIQYHFGFYPPAVLASIVDALAAQGVAVAVTFHVITHDHHDLSAIVPSLAKASAIFSHRQSDADYFASLGLTTADILPHGIFVPAGFTGERTLSPIDSKFTVGAFGFLMPHKGFLELMAACHLVRAHVPDLRVKIFASAYPNESSAKLLTRCHAYMTYLDNLDYTEFHSEFLDANEVTQQLQQCNVVVFPYQRTQESSSAAVRMGLASGRPVLCTPLDIFDDVRGAVLFTDGFDAFAIARGLLNFYKDPQSAWETSRIQQHYLNTHSWEAVADLLLEKLSLGYKKSGVV